MKPLFSKLYTFISLATPHVGSRFPDSKLVSTGMWALFKWKKYKALKVREQKGLKFSDSNRCCILIIVTHMIYLCIAVYIVDYCLYIAISLSLEFCCCYIVFTMYYPHI